MPLDKSDLATIQRLVRDHVGKMPPRPVKAQTISTVTTDQVVLTSGDSVLSGNIQGIQTNQAVIWDGNHFVPSRGPIPYITSSAMSGGPPSSPSDGDIWIALAAGASGENWMFRYNAGSGSPYKWEFIGGPPVQVVRTVTTDTVTSNTVWKVDPGLGAITWPRAGEYLFRSAGYWVSGSASANTSQQGLWYNGSQDVAFTEQSVGGAWAAVWAIDVEVGVAAGSTGALSHWNNTASAITLGYRSLSTIPRRIS